MSFLFSCNQLYVILSYMKTTSIIKDKTTKKEKDPERMDLLMRTLKAVHDLGTSPTAITPEELHKQRASMEIFSKLATPPVMLNDNAFMVDGIPSERIVPEYPHRKDVIIMHCHGGGYTCGGLGYARILGSKLALHTGIEVITFEYGLAPENPFPGPIEDGLKIWDYLLHQGYGAKNIILTGDSAGGNMALEICLRLKQEGRLLPKALVLFSPWTDMRATNPSYELNKEKDPTITYEYVCSVRGAYAGFDADFEDPALSPLLADLSNMPPTLIQVGSTEILKDDSEKLAKNLTKAGSYSKLEIYSGGWHVFQGMPIPRAVHAIDAVKDFLDYVL